MLRLVVPLVWGMNRVQASSKFAIATATIIAAVTLFPTAVTANPHPGEQGSRYVSGTHHPIPLRGSSRVIIVGGGAAGVHFASLLAERGVTRILLLEAEAEVGGKTRDVWLPDDPVPHAMGAIAVPDYYKPVFDPLLRKYCPDNKLIDIDPVTKPDSYFVMGEDVGQSDANVSFGINQWVDAQNFVAKQHGLPKDSLLVVAQFAADLERYVAVHRRIFGAYPPGMPPPPLDWSLVNMTIGQFLKAHNLFSLSVFIQMLYQDVGYGTVSSGPAFYLLWYLQPSVVRSLLKCAAEKRPFQYKLSKGFQYLFVRMAEFYERKGVLEVRTGARVTAVTRGLSTGGPCQVTYVNSSSQQPITVEGDWVVMAVDLKRFASLVQDLQGEEAQAMSGYEGHMYVTTLVETDSATPVDRPVVTWYARMDGNGNGSAGGARLYALFNERKAMYGEPVRGSDGTLWYSNTTGRQRRIAYQWMEGVASADMAQWNATLDKDLGMMVGGVEYLAQAVWPYFSHFSMEALVRGNPWRIVAMQGKRKALWIGSSVSFETTYEVLRYNMHLNRRIVMFD